MSDFVYRDHGGRKRGLRRRDLELMVSYLRSDLFKRNVGEHAFRVVEISCCQELEYILRGGRIPEDV